MGKINLELIEARCESGTWTTTLIKHYSWSFLTGLLSHGYSLYAVYLCTFLRARLFVLFILLESCQDHRTSEQLATSSSKIPSRFWLQRSLRGPGKVNTGVSSSRQPNPSRLIVLGGVWLLVSNLAVLLALAVSQPHHLGSLLGHPRPCSSPFPTAPPPFRPCSASVPDDPSSGRPPPPPP